MNKDGMDVLSFQGHKYQIVGGQYDWDEADNDCKNKGGDLATINAQEEQMKLLSVQCQRSIGDLIVSC